MPDEKRNSEGLLLESLQKDIGLEGSVIRVSKSPGEVDSFLSWDFPEGLGSWSRTRLFEATIAHEGLTRYLRALSAYSGNKPEKDVKLNTLLAATHLSTSLNQVIWETITSLKKSGKTILDEEQLRAIGSVLKPSKDYRLNDSQIGVDFDPLVIEDLRSEILRSIYDQLDAHTVQLLKDRVSQLQKAMADNKGKPEAGRRVLEEIPDDLEPIGMMNSFDISKGLALSRKYGSLRLIIKSGYVIWKFAGRPTVYFKDNNAHYSKKLSGGTLDEGRLQLQVISKLLSTDSRLCALCNDQAGSELAYLATGAVGFVCSGCERNPQVLRLIASIVPSEA